MSDNFCDWHVLHVTEEDGERDIEVLHPAGCPLSIDKGQHGTIYQYNCWVGWEMSEGGCIGYTTLDEYEPGWYRVRGRTYTTPSGPWGPPDADVEAEDFPIRWEKESEIEVGVT